MLRNVEKRFALVFSITVVLELICGSIERFNSFHYVTKPAIVTLLIWHFIKKSKHLHRSARILTVFALGFSLIGDVLLMFVDNSPLFFTTGLAAFLLAHVMYVSVFLKKRNGQTKPYTFVLTLLIYASALFYLLKDGLGNMLIPVLLYMTIILFMATAALMRKGKVIPTSFWMVFVGSLFFMTSDSILAFNKFYEPINYAGIYIMLTYASAQYLITIGILEQKN